MAGFSSSGSPATARSRNLSHSRSCAFLRAASQWSCEPGSRITEDKIAAFVETMRGNVLSGDTPFRRAWLRSIIDGVEVDDTESVFTEGGQFWSVW
ncbi:hypothetical protein PV773_06370 [Mesorhizobium sp. CC13]|uniref:hypothetical protein n=1 Tax=Mesorhizobium sp. CC13 TaxID=3029194 RepID=UPI003263DD0A